jgi:ribosome recycling factor
LKEEFQGKELDDVKNEYQTSLDECLESLEEEMNQIKSGRASPTIFNDLEVKAYGEMQMFGDLAMTVVQGNNKLMVKVFDDSVKDEVLKCLNRSDFDLSVQMEGKDIRVKMGTSRKEHIAAGIAKAKKAHENFRKGVRDARQEARETLKKLAKIIA